MMRHHVLIFAALSFGTITEAQAQRPPNVVVVMMDDLGYGDLGSYGASDVRTPNIDRLAREGVRLTDAYANGPVCTPTRAALIAPASYRLDGIDLLPILRGKAPLLERRLFWRGARPDRQIGRA